MAHKAWIGSSLVFATLWAGVITAQDKPPDSIAGMPAARGVYYRSGAEWVALPANLLFPFLDGGAVKQLLWDGSRDGVAEMRGSHAALQIKNGRPTFYVRGIAPTGGLYMVEGITKRDHRELRMPTSRHFREWAHYRSQDLHEIDLRAVGAQVYSVTPRADLKPGEYALASAVDSQGRWIRLGFEFGVSTTP